MKLYTIYAHINKCNGKTYIGQTCQSLERRWRKGDGYSNNVYFKRALDKYGWDNFLHLILYSNLSKEQANQLEITLIQYYKSINLSYNITNGGEGTIGLHTPKTIEHKTNISKALKGKPKSKEAIAKMKANHHHSLDTPIYKYSRDGEFICSYSTIAIAAKDTNVAATHISRCARGKRPTCGGFIWKYNKD
jgi:group I intron endonuclease